MEGQNFKIKVNFSWHLIWIFALLEGVTVPLVPLFFENGPRVKTTTEPATGFAIFAKTMLVLGVYGMAIGFIGTLVVCLVLNYTVFRSRKFHLNGAVIMRVTNPLIIGLWGGLLLANIFWIQYCSRSLSVDSLRVNQLIWGFVSAAGSIVVTSAVYLVVATILPHSRIQVTTAEQQLSLANISIASFALLVGLYEGLAAPILSTWELAPHHRVLIALLVGLSGGALSSLIVVALAHIRAINKHMWLEFSIVKRPVSTR